jgi:hypothetical protein
MIMFHFCILLLRKPRLLLRHHPRKRMIQQQALSNLIAAASVTGCPHTRA